MSANASRLSGVTKELRLQWLQTREHWQDARALDFQAKYLEDLFNTVEKTVTVMDQLDKLVSQMKKDCE